MDQKDQYEEVGQWLAEQFQIDVIVCRIFGKRWAYEWSNINHIENARRIQLSYSMGLIVPASTSDEKARLIKNQVTDHWKNLKT